MMEKEFVPYEQALVLKKLGFGEPCFVYDFWPNAEQRAVVYHTPEIARNWNERSDCVSLPLYQQAFRWFRDKYMLSGAIIPTTINYRDDTMEYTYDIRGKYTTCVLIGTYEESELECLKKLIEIAKENK